MTLFSLKNQDTQSLAANLASAIVGIGVPLAAAIVLRRRSADLT